jgi:peptide/nickel transport system permease protein
VSIYIIRRLVWVAIVIALVTFLTFVIFYLLPSGDPATRFAGRQPSEETLAEIREQFGLDKPWYTQYAYFVKDFFAGDEYGWPGLGFSFDSRVPIIDEIKERAPRTLFLALGASIIWLVSGVAIGILSALKRGTIIDRLAMGFALFGVSAPVFWVGLIFLYVFWEKLGWAPGSGYVEFSESPAQWAAHLAMPCVVVALSFAAFYSRMTRGNLLETMGEDYIRTARAKGLSERRVIFKHGLRSSLTPVTTMFGMDVALLIGGAVLTETVFNLQGLGAWTVRSTFRGDLPAVMGVTLILAAVVALMNMVVDIVYAYLDPRVRYQ